MSRPHRPLPRPAPTTLRRSLPALALLLALPARAEPVDEATLVRQALAAPAGAAELRAVDAETRAARTASPLLQDPAVEVRHEQANGDWGARTDAVGASLTVDLGLSALGHTRAGHLRGEAGAHRREAVALEQACTVRAHAADLEAASAAAAISRSAQDRLEGLLAQLTALAQAGEASGYDRDRTALAVVAHQTEARRRAGEAETYRAQVSARVGAPVDGVLLAPLPGSRPLDAALEALAGHPVLDALALERDAARTSRNAARRGQLPDLTVSGGPRWDAAPTGGPAAQGFEVAGAVQLPFADGSRAESRQQDAAYTETDARLIQARARLESAVRSAHHRLVALGAGSTVQADPEAVWTAALDRYTAGESSLDDLLQVAGAVEAAELATVEGERLTRRAHLDLSCAVGRFSDPAVQSALEEATR